MKNILRTYILGTFGLVFSASILHAQFNALETENLRLIYYGELHSYLVPHIARCFENALTFHRHLFHYTSKEKVTVLIHDFNDYGNAGAGVIPRNHISVSLAPFSYAYETAPANERMNSTMNHELVHIVAYDKAHGTDTFFRSLFFGKVAETSDNPLTIVYSYLTAPRRSAPRWYHEGIAVFLETWMAGGLGRALGPYDEMVFRTMVRDDRHFYYPVGLEAEGTKVDFHVTVNSYLYGTRFFNYLAYQYGPESLIQWVSRTHDSKSYFQSQFKKVYGLPLDEVWSQWIEYEREFQRANLESIRTYPTTPYRTISHQDLGSVSRAYFDPSDRKLYAAVNYPGQVAHIAAIDVDNGRIEKICDIKGPALFFVSSLTYDPDSSAVFYTTDNYDWRDLKVVNTQSGESKMLQKDVRVGDLAFHQRDKSIWGVRHDSGLSTLVRIPYPYDEWNQIYTLPYGQDIYDLDISPDGKRLSASLAEINGRQRLIAMNIQELMAGQTSYTTLFDFENSIPNNFVFSLDGRYLYGTSYYTGVSNVFRYDFEADSMVIISNCETGFFRPIPVSDDSLIVFRYTSKGFVPAMISNKPVQHVNAIRFLGQEVVEKYPIVKEWMARSPASVSIDSLTTYSGKYQSLRNVRLASAYPVVEGYKDFGAVGMRLNISGPIGIHNLDATFSYTPDKRLSEDERMHTELNYTHMGTKVFARYNDADFYDLFGPTKTSRKGYSLGVQYKKTLLFDEPKKMDYLIRVVGYGGLERLPDFQNIAASYDKLLSANVNFNYKNLRASLGAVDYEKGYTWQIVSYTNYVNREFFPHLLTNLNYGFPLPIHHSSIWLRSSFGYAYGDRDEPFANFYFGGFGNNWVDYLHEKRYREYYSFPGVELNAIGGTNYAKMIFEWSLPPIRFRRLGFPAFYCTWIRTALFSSGIVTNVDEKSYRSSLLNVGAQLDVRIMMLSHLDTTFSIGYAAAFEEHETLSKEFMISLKILK